MTGSPFSSPNAGTQTPPRSVLVVVTRRVGDVLLATPLIRSIRRAWPEVAIDVLVFDGTQGAIAANPDIRHIHVVPERPGLLRHLVFVLRLARRYDVALSLVPGDRPTFYAFLAGRWRAGLLLDTAKQRWKRRFLNRWVPFDDLNTHTVRMHLALAGVLGIVAHSEVVVSWRTEDEHQVDELLVSDHPQRLVVLHTYPKFNYKMWRREGWIEVARWLAARGFRLALTGSADADEMAYVGALAQQMPPGTLNLAGRLSLSAAGCLLTRARLYVGPDTALTHMAAGLGVPTVAFYGPTDPVKWGPWPKGYAGSGNPWRRLGNQAVERVRLVQGNAPCAPCLKEGCQRHVDSFSDCLQQLPAARIIAAIENVLGPIAHA